MSYYPGLDSNIRDKVKVVLDLTNYANKKELNNSTGVNTSNLGGEVKHELRVTSYELRFQIHEVKFTSYEFKSTSYEFRSTSYEFKSTS